MVLVFSTSKIYGQKNSKLVLKDFQISISFSGDGIILKSSKGSAWTELAFSLNNKPQYIDEFGMVSSNNKNQSSSPKFADYFFSISKDGEEIVLQARKGTAWDYISFTLPVESSQSFNQYGTVRSVSN